MRFRKTYVDVVARIDVDGRITPLSIRWRDGRTFEIDRVKEVIRRASTRVGGTGLRYLVMVNGREKYLFFEGPRWFVEEVVLEVADAHAGNPRKGVPGAPGDAVFSASERAPKTYRAPRSTSSASENAAALPPAVPPTAGSASRAFARLIEALRRRSHLPLPRPRAPRA